MSGVQLILQPRVWSPLKRGRGRRILKIKGAVPDWGQVQKIKGGGDPRASYGFVNCLRDGSWNQRIHYQMHLRCQGKFQEHNLSLQSRVL